MVHKKSLLALFCIVLFVAAQSVAQGQVLQTTYELTARQTSELKKWMKDDAKFLRWYKVKGNRARVKLRHRPEPPEWLEAECKHSFGGEGLLVDACNLLKETKEDYRTMSLRQTIAAQRTNRESPKTRFIEKIHFGGGWPIVDDYRNMKYGAVFESHISIADIGRIETNLPGIMILSLPDAGGVRRLKPAIHLGIGYRLRDFRIPGARQMYVLHFNIANAWTSEDLGGVGFESRLSLVGLSMTIKKNQ